VYLNDILVAEKSTEKHLKNLEEVLSRLIKNCRYASEKVKMCLFAPTGSIPGSSDIGKGIKTYYTEV